MIYQSYYILSHKDEVNQFLTEDRTFTFSLDSALKLINEEEAQEVINSYIENEKDDYFTGEYYISEYLEIKKVSINIQ